MYKFTPFTSDVSSIHSYLRELHGEWPNSAILDRADHELAGGGGDGPEAVTSGLAASLTELEWRRAASKMVVLIADAPPHGELPHNLSSW